MKNYMLKHKRHIKFAMQPINIPTQLQFGINEIQIDHFDLIRDISLEIELEEKYKWININKLIKSISFVCGESPIQTLYQNEIESIKTENKILFFFKFFFGKTGLNTHCIYHQNKYLRIETELSKNLIAGESIILPDLNSILHINSCILDEEYRIKLRENTYCCFFDRTIKVNEIELKLDNNLKSYGKLPFDARAIGRYCLISERTNTNNLDILPIVDQEFIEKENYYIYKDQYVYDITFKRNPKKDYYFGLEMFEENESKLLIINGISGCFDSDFDVPITEFSFG